MNALTNQINQLNAMKNQGITDPKAIQYMLGQNFNQMLDQIMASNDSEDENKNKDTTFLPSTYSPVNNRAYVENLLQQNNKDAVNPSLTDPDYLSSFF